MGHLSDQIQSISIYKYFSKTNLNPGSGCAWAGHIRANLDPNPALEFDIVEDELNWGLDPPIGSKETFQCFESFTKLNTINNFFLNSGIGWN